MYCWSMTQNLQEIFHSHLKFQIVWLLKWMDFTTIWSFPLKKFQIIQLIWPVHHIPKLLKSCNSIVVKMCLFLFFLFSMWIWIGDSIYLKKKQRTNWCHVISDKNSPKWSLFGVCFGSLKWPMQNFCNFHSSW